ncbi:MAG: hypothetical protein JHC95_12345 [Solirubrobacteraceae bacterium]|nr:hypothetical protein [Solirubrobacteraceae bacterium]
MTGRPDSGSQDVGRTPRAVRLPVFVSDEPVGLGDVLKRATSSIGIKPCGGCADRAARLNQRVAFTGRGK